MHLICRAYGVGDLGACGLLLIIFAAEFERSVTAKDEFNKGNLGGDISWTALMSRICDIVIVASLKCYAKPLDRNVGK